MDKTSPQIEIPDPPAVREGAHTHEGPRPAAAGGAVDLDFLAELAAALCPGLPRETAQARIADLPGLTTARGAAFLREAIPAAKARGARFPFGAALSTWSAWSAAQSAQERPSAPLLAPAPLSTPRRPGEARPVAALEDREDFLAKVRAARQALQRTAPPSQRPDTFGGGLENT